MHDLVVCSNGIYVCTASVPWESWQRLDVEASDNGWETFASSVDSTNISIARGLVYLALTRVLPNTDRRYYLCHSVKLSCGGYDIDSDDEATRGAERLHNILISASNQDTRQRPTNPHGITHAALQKKPSHAHLTTMTSR